jgi:hypothetical protein
MMSSEQSSVINQQSSMLSERQGSMGNEQAAIINQQSSMSGVKH